MAEVLQKRVQICCVRAASLQLDQVYGVITPPRSACHRR
ncbi:hypothetical protein EV13_2485 [Prochlorococcus sp. MIT 0702]|nr:hypothetical protein EV12_2270 [Prochlorococcus sp. MIT 0701]KGG26353.1 hypothetical protein EV13_2485 [Prochlorococcus sp. MIT 0702]KGG31228.1 hypothetical protein EV14_2600 [Prochlorococcus sp. MIT 0703]